MTHPELVAARRNVAIGKLSAFIGECWRLADLAAGGTLDRIEAVDTLQDVAACNDLPAVFGADYVASLMAEPFAESAQLGHSAGRAA
jgi:hypothetical protein